MKAAVRVDALALATLALLLYLLLGQHTFYKIDGHLYLVYVLNGERSYPRHFAYLPLVFAARDLLSPFGLTLYEAARALSAVGAACGVGLLHLASGQLGLGRKDAVLVTALAATVPSVVFFATVVEVHGAFLAFYGVAAWCAARLAHTPTVGRAALFGAACALAFCAHSTAILLPALLLPLLLLYPRRRFAQAIIAGTVTTLTMAVGVGLSPLVAELVRVDFDLHHSSEFATDRAARNFGDLWRYGHTLLYEWLLPMLPLSVVVPFLALVPRVRAQAAWLMVAAGIYLFFAIMILGGEPEWGAYLLPFCWPLGLLARRVLRPTLMLTVIGVQLGLGITGVRIHDDPRATSAYADDVRALAGDARIAVLVGDDLDLQALLLHLPRAKRVPLFELARLPAAGLPEAARLLMNELDGLLDGGAAVFLSDGARARVSAIPAATPCGPGLLEAIDQRYKLARSQRADFLGSRITR